MTGRRKEKGKDVTDVYFPKEQTAVEETIDADVVGVQPEEELEAAGRASLGEFVPGGKSWKIKNRRRLGRSKATTAPGFTQANRVSSAVEREEKQDAAVSDHSSDLRNGDSSYDTTSGASVEPRDSNAGTQSDIAKVNSVDGQSKEAEVHGRRGEESILQRLGRVIKACVIPPLSTEELESNLQEQADEILAMEAIYGEDFKRFTSEHIATPSFMISVSVETPEDLTLWADHPSTSKSRSPSGTEESSVIDGNSVASSSESSQADSTHFFTVQSLPPLRLVYTLPVSFLGISEKLELGPYGVGGEIFRRVESDERVSSGCISFESDISRLLRYNEEKRSEEFCKSLHTCYICFTEHLGKDFVRLPCQHKFCVGCMQTLASVHVKEGSVDKLNCADTSCRGSIAPYILKQLLEEEVFQRWEDLVLQRSLDAMIDIVYCPRCETVCIEEENNFVQCTKCFYSFCGLCRQSWHVGQECMSTEARLSVLKARQKGRNLGEEQRRKEQDLINEMMNMQYVHREAKQCPQCKMAISKTEGCNKMVCSNCGQYFCFKCGKRIGGYDHFQDGSCALFEGEEIQRWRPQNHQPQVMIELELWPERGRPCPNCRQLNVKLGNNNHIYCWACRSSYCCVCYKLVRRTSEHFGPGPHKCRQHSTD